MKIFCLLIIAIALSACDQKSSPDDAKERARAEEEAGNDVANENLANRAKKMEEDLRKRYRFYSGVSHDYFANFNIGNNKYKAKLTFTPTLHIVETDRVRALEEIQEDLNNLYLNAQVVIWSDPDTIGANGCVFEKNRPDITTGKIQLVSTECPNRFAMKLTVPNTPSNERDLTSKLLAEALLSGTQNKVDYIYSQVNSKFNPNSYEITFKRVE